MPGWGFVLLIVGAMTALLATLHVYWFVIPWYCKKCGGRVECLGSDYKDNGPWWRCENCGSVGGDSVRR